MYKRQEVFNNLVARLEELKETIGIKKTIKDYGIDEKYFLDTLDDMVEQAFNDQCTGANPRYPLMKEIKEIYLCLLYTSRASGTWIRNNIRQFPEKNYAFIPSGSSYQFC